ncbi:uncharacterized protein LOC120427304 isoform X1 [Culex pipiens pallens]|uniref:uncharacterized protein LOC120427304 isoform X1 n=1 Tax=Culex pipiens pallens TaxID=42434 RepID=UPI0019530484|nr:uncharacterized protein LOC120427304 isoform X1 [Culex pipiens pallens]
MRRWFAVRDVYEVVRPLAHLSTLFGLASTPVFYNPTSWSSRLVPTRGSTWISVVYLVAFFALYTYSTYLTIFVQLFHVLYKSLIVGRTEYAYAVIMYVVIVFSMVFLYLVRDKLAKLLHLLHQVDRGLADFPSAINSDHQRAHFQLTVAIWSVAIVTGVMVGVGYCYYTTIFATFLYNAQTVIAYLLSINGYTLSMIQASTMVLLAKDRFAAINGTFRMYFPTTPTSGGFLTTTAPGHTAETAVCSEKEQLTVLRQIKILHDKLNDVVELVNYCFSVQITFCVGLCFVIGVVCSFGLFRAFIYRNELFYMGVLNFIWYMYYLFFVLFFIAVGSKITREGKRIGVLVHKAINCSTSTAVINELNIFSQQLLHRSPVITCGLFVYDWTLLYTVSYSGGGCKINSIN